MSIKPLSDYELMPIYVRVADDLRTKLDNGTFKQGTFLPSELELSKAYELSRGTIRKALDILASEGRISRQQGRGTLVLSVPKHNQEARPQIAVVWSIIRQIGTEMFAGLESVISHLGYDLLFSTSDHQPLKEAEILERLLDSDVAGIALYATGYNHDLLKKFVDKGIPMVLLDRFMPDIEHDVNWVTSDNQDGARQIVQHLIENGHRRIAMICWTPDHERINTLTERFEGYRQALLDAGIGFDPAFHLSVCGPHYWEQGERGFADRLFALIEGQNPTAIFFNSDAAALRAYPLLRAMNIDIPEHLSLAGFDRLRIPFINSLNPPHLTTVVQDFERLGKEAGYALVNLIQNPSLAPVHIRVPVSLHVGETTSTLTPDLRKERRSIGKN